MKRLSLLFLAAAAAAPAFAQSGAPADPVLVENARVRSSTPVYAEVQVPRKECTTQTVEKPAPQEKHNLVGAGLGAVAGGLLGHTVGGGSGKTAATAVGAVAGALVGNELANRSANVQAERAPAEVQNCKTVKETQSRLVGYRVRYEYNGREFESIVRSNPGSTLPVLLSVTPVDTP